MDKPNRQVQKTIEKLKNSDWKPGYRFGAYVRGEKEHVVMRFSTAEQIKEYIEKHPDFTLNIQ